MRQAATALSTCTAHAPPAHQAASVHVHVMHASPSPTLDSVALP